MGYKAEVILKSVGPNRIPLCTMLLRYPRTVHAEVLRHRMFSSNVKSSRAKPIRKYIEEVLQDGYIPFFWGASRKGMQSSAEEVKHTWLAKLAWNMGLYVAVGLAWTMLKIGVHKQIANRLLEPFLYVDHLVTGTEAAWNNFFALRSGLDGAADPAIQKIARMAARAYRSSPTQKLRHLEWHLPFITNDDIVKASARHAYDDQRYIDSNIDLELCKISAARCARLSYYTFNSSNMSSIEEDLKLFDKLMGSTPVHASPCEMQAQALHDVDNWDYNVEVYKECGNLIGWRQFRKTLSNEVQTEFDLWSITDEPYIIK